MLHCFARHRVEKKKIDFLQCRDTPLITVNICKILFTLNEIKTFDVKHRDSDPSAGIIP